MVPGVGAGTYAWTVLDANDCEADVDFELIAPPLLEADWDGEILCYGDLIDVTVTATGGTPPYRLFDGDIFVGDFTDDTFVVPGVGAGTYVWTVLDANDCEADVDFELIAPPLLTCTAEEDYPASCDLSVGGSATVYPVGGTPFEGDGVEPYLYSWKDEWDAEVGTTATVDDLAPGVYTVTVTDANGCTTTCNVTITREPEEFINCETAFAKGDVSKCFIPDFGNWGWTNLISEGTYEEMPLYAGAAQCDISKGAKVGYIEVTYSKAEGKVTVNFVMYEGYAMNEAHVYVGSDKYPKFKRGRKWVSTVAPGQYPYVSGPLENVAGLTGIEFTGVSGDLYIIAHAVTCEAVCDWEREIVNLTEEIVADNKSAEIVTQELEAKDLKVYPNPFGDKVTFEFVSAKDARARLEITNVLGQRIAVLMNENVKEGLLNRVEYKPVDVATGILIYRLILDEGVQSGRIIYKKE